MPGSFVGFLINQANIHPSYTPILGCDSEGGRATRMAPDATTEKLRDKNKSRFTSGQAVRSNSFMSKESPGGGKSREQKINKK